MSAGRQLRRAVLTSLLASLIVLYPSVAHSEMFMLPIEHHLPLAQLREKPTIGSTMAQEVRKIAILAGSSDPDFIVALARCESSLNPLAVHVNADGSVDEGLLQWNRRYHPEISTACAFSVDCAISAAVHRIEAGYAHEWACTAKIRRRE